MSNRTKKDAFVIGMAATVLLVTTATIGFVTGDWEPFIGLGRAAGVTVAVIAMFGLLSKLADKIWSDNDE